MDKKIVLAYGLACLLLLSLMLNVAFLVRQSQQARRATSDTTRVTLVDTIPYLHPVPMDSVVVRYETERLPHVKETGNSLTQGDAHVKDTSLSLTRPMHSICTDSVSVKIPITQKRYADSTYTAWVSGYHPTLDSIFVYPRHEVMTITNTIRQKPKRWGVGLNVGYGITPKHGMQPYIGIGIQYNLFSF